MTAAAFEEEQLKLLKLKAQLQEMEENLRRDGENLYQQAKERCAKELAEIEKREKALAPKEASLKERELEASSKLADAKNLATDISRRENILRELQKELADRSHFISAEEQRLTDLRTKQEARFAAECADIENRHAILTRRQNAISTEQSEAAADLQKRESAIADRFKVVDQEVARTSQLRAEAEQLLKDANQTVKDRLKELELKDDEYKRLIGRIAGKEQALVAATAENRRKADALARQQKELDERDAKSSKVQLDLEIKEMELNKRESMIDAKIRKFELQKESVK